MEQYHVNGNGIRPSRPIQVNVSIENLAKRAGLNQLANPKIIEKLKRLNEGSKTVEDEERAINLLLDFFEYYNKTKPEKAFTPAEQDTVTGGTFLSDVGKTGPADASPELSACITDMFNIDVHIDTDIVNVKTFLEYFLPEEKQEKYLKILSDNGLDTEMSLRSFINKHAQWTLDIIKIEDGKGIPHDVVVAAASHHFLEGVNPLNVAKLSRADKMVILLDKYDARRRRGTTSHYVAIQWLKETIDPSKGEDVEQRKKRLAKIINEDEKKEFLELIGDMEIAFHDNKAYDNVPKINNGEYHSPKP
jgi:hypothetical protein